MKSLILLMFLCSFSVLSQPNYFTYWDYQIDSIDASKLSIDSSNADNFIWQFGQSYKSTFGNSSVLILATDTINSLDSAYDSSINLLLERPYQWGNIVEGAAYVLEFDHKVVGDSSSAGGFFEINIDNDTLSYVKNGDTLQTYWLRYPLISGETENYSQTVSESWWYEMYTDSNDLITLSDLFDNNVDSWANNYHHIINGYHDSIPNNNIGFTGKYPHYKHFYMEFEFAIGGVKANDINDSLNFRFHFISDSSASSMDGWAIKNLKSGYAVHPTGSMVEHANSKIKLFPNPSSGLIRLDAIDLGSEKKVCKIYSISGTEILSQEFDQVLSLDLSREQNGAFLIQIFSLKGELLETSRIILND